MITVNVPINDTVEFRGSTKSITPSLATLSTWFYCRPNPLVIFHVDCRNLLKDVIVSESLPFIILSLHPRFLFVELYINNRITGNGLGSQLRYQWQIVPLPLQEQLFQKIFYKYKLNQLNSDYRMEQLERRFVRTRI